MKYWGKLDLFPCLFGKWKQEVSLFSSISQELHPKKGPIEGRGRKKGLETAAKADGAKILEEEGTSNDVLSLHSFQGSSRAFFHGTTNARLMVLFLSSPRTMM